MSLSYTVDVHCDRCGNWTHGATGHRKNGLATTALRVAKKEGWSRDVNSLHVDLCPSCLVESRKEPK